MEEIKHLKIETVTHIFSKFTRMQGDVFDSCIHSFFTRMGRVAHPTTWLSQRVGLNHVAGWSAWASFNYWKPRAPVIPALYIYMCVCLAVYGCWLCACNKSLVEYSYHVDSSRNIQCTTNL
jgi:hypothetical protein